jgi:hypothetical protein
LVCHLYTRGFLQQLKGLLNVSLTFTLPLQTLLEVFCGLSILLLKFHKGIDKWGSYYPLFDVVVGRFSKLLRILGIIKDIVMHLKGYA